MRTFAKQNTNKKQTFNKRNIDMKRKVVKISRERAIEIAMNHNCVSLEIAERYTDSELREILNHLKLKANF